VSRRPAFALAALLVLALALVGAGCGGGGKDKSSTSGATSKQSALSIRAFKFIPADVEVAAGAKVSWVNLDTASHTATSDTGGAFDTGTIDRGKTKSVVLSKPGTYAYHCAFHPFMHGKVVVR
jgi:plastocyanin